MAFFARHDRHLEKHVVWLIREFQPFREETHEPIYMKLALCRVRTQPYPGYFPGFYPCRSFFKSSTLIPIPEALCFLYARGTIPGVRVCPFKNTRVRVRVRVRVQHSYTYLGTAVSSVRLPYPYLKLL